MTIEEKEMPIQSAMRKHLNKAARIYILQWQMTILVVTTRLVVASDKLRSGWKEKTAESKGDGDWLETK